MNVTALLTNDSAGIACLIEDKLYWEVTTIGTSVLGRWEFVYDNVGVDVTNTVGIDDIEPTTASVYPNPSSDVINISLNKGQLLKIELFSMTGRLIFKKDLTGTSCSGLPRETTRDTALPHRSGGSKVMTTFVLVSCLNYIST